MILNLMMDKSSASIFIHMSFCWQQVRKNFDHCALSYFVMLIWWVFGTVSQSVMELHEVHKFLLHTFLFCFIFKSEECFLTTIGILCSNLCARKIFEKGEQKLI